MVVLTVLWLQPVTACWSMSATLVAHDFQSLVISEVPLKDVGCRSSGKMNLGVLCCNS